MKALRMFCIVIFSGNVMFSALMGNIPSLFGWLSALIFVTKDYITKE